MIINSVDEVSKKATLQIGIYKDLNLIGLCYVEITIQWGDYNENDQKHNQSLDKKAEREKGKMSYQERLCRTHDSYHEKSKKCGVH